MRKRVIVFAFFQGGLIVLAMYSFTPQLEIFLKNGMLVDPFYTAICAVSIVFTAAASLLLTVYAAHRLQKKHEKVTFNIMYKHSVHIILILFCLLPAWLMILFLEEKYTQVIIPILLSDPNNLSLGMILVYTLAPAIFRALLLPFLQHPLFMNLADPQPVRHCFRTAFKTLKSSYMFLLRWNLIGIVLQIISPVFFTLLSVHGPVVFDDDFPVTFINSMILSGLFYKFLCRYINGEKYDP